MAITCKLKFYKNTLILRMPSDEILLNA
jgi:hypothetical protein